MGHIVGTNSTAVGDEAIAVAVPVLEIPLYTMANNFPTIMLLQRKLTKQRPMMLSTPITFGRRGYPIGASISQDLR